MNIGKRLKAYREYHQLTQEDLGRKPESMKNIMEE